MLGMMKTDIGNRGCIGMLVGCRMGLVGGSILFLVEEEVRTETALLKLKQF